MKKKKLPLVCWDSIKITKPHFSCYGEFVSEQMRIREVNIEKQLFDYDWKFKVGGLS